MQNNLPIQRDGNQCEHRRRHRHVGHEVVDGAVHGSERPVRVEHEDEVERTVEGRHQQVGHAQIQQEIVGHRSHPAVGCFLFWNEE